MPTSDRDAKKYIAGFLSAGRRFRRPRTDDKKKHEDMGFHKGRGQCADQLEALAKTL